MSTETETKIPHANEVGADPVVAEEQPEAENPLSPEEKETQRTTLVSGCINYLAHYILEEKAPGKIRYRHGQNKNDSYIFRFSPPAKERGKDTRYFSYVKINRKTNECELEKSRPVRHSRDLWYFPVIYLMTGKSMNEKRCFQRVEQDDEFVRPDGQAEPEQPVTKLDLTSVKKLVRDRLENLGYTVEFKYNRMIGNVVRVEWPKAEEEQVADEPAQAEAPAQNDEPAPAEAPAPVEA